ncbi:MAG: hypothetical protein AVO35_11400 [Candidatus Aegiribacteria sp. MLS_C]|nr:MAG: hypothetical protein AVO35_11400 [Candidatus Aegiribacteria sp. MLS_C]
MRKPAVSVLLPFSNDAEYLDGALESLSCQTMEDFEVLMVDDGSFDGSKAIAADRCRSDGRFRILRNTGIGLVDALNSGLSECLGEWVARMDADDVCEPGRLDEQLREAMARGPGTVVTCRVRCFPEDGITDGYRSYEEWINSLVSPEEIQRNIFVESPVPHPTAFYHRERVISEGGYMERILPEDYELWLRLWSRGYRFSRVPLVLLRWRDRPDRFSRHSPAYSLTNFYRLKARYLRYVPCMAGRRVFVAGGGQTARRLGKCLQENGFFIEAFLVPGPPGSRSRLRGRPVLDTSVLENRRGIPVVIASREPGARKRIADLLTGMGLREWHDFLACA